jgi:transcription antitermination factor NusG
MSAWLVARVITNSEQSVKERLARIGTESYWPKFRDTIRDFRTARKRSVIRPLYPCYLFVKSDEFYFLFDVQGVVGIIMRGIIPERSRRLDFEIQKMKASENDGFVSKPIVESPPRLISGSRVVILSGILKGCSATCKEFRGSKVKVVTDLFGGETPVWHSERDLAAAA